MAKTKRPLAWCGEGRRSGVRSDGRSRRASSEERSGARLELVQGLLGRGGMSDQPAADPASPSTPAAASGSKLTLILLVIGVANLGATGFVAVSGGHGSSGGGGEGAPAAHAVVVPVTAPFDPLVVNLNEPGSSRYLKTSFDLELASQEALEELGRGKRGVRDQVLRYLSSLSVADTLGETGKTKIQQEIMTRIDKELGGGRVRRLYYTDFVVQ